MAEAALDWDFPEPFTRELVVGPGDIDELGHTNTTRYAVLMYVRGVRGTIQIVILKYAFTTTNQDNTEVLCFDTCVIATRPITRRGSDAIAIKWCRITDNDATT